MIFLAMKYIILTFCIYGIYSKPVSSNAESNNLHIKNASIDRLKNNKVFLDNKYYKDNSFHNMNGLKGTNVTEDRFNNVQLKGNNKKYENTKIIDSYGKVYNCDNNGYCNPAKQY
tara:strand:- start:238 stop:582 length:345 start_codon:yes stop_codon:yes gene_type:complete